MLNKILLLIIAIIFSQFSLAKDITSHNNVAEITPLMNAVMNNDTDAVKFFATKEQEIIDKQNIAGATALHLAARRDNPEIVRILLKNNAKINLKDAEGWTPIMRAASSCKIENAKILLNFGANIFFNNQNQESAILYATNSRCLQIITEFKEIILLKYSFLELKNFRKNIQKSIYIASRNENAKIKKELEEILNHLDNLYKIKKSKKPIKQNDKIVTKLDNLEQKIHSPKEKEVPINNISQDKLKPNKLIDLSNIQKKDSNKITYRIPKKPEIIQNIKKDNINNEKSEQSTEIKTDNQKIKAKIKKKKIKFQQKKDIVQNSKKIIEKDIITPKIDKKFKFKSSKNITIPKKEENIEIINLTPNLKNILKNQNNKNKRKKFKFRKNPVITLKKEDNILPKKEKNSKKKFKFRKKTDHIQNPDNRN
jgi:ankyrin repeat protein